MPALFSNNASAALASSITTSSTSITVVTGAGSLFPAVPAGSFFYATLTDSSNNLEIVKVTGRTADVLTVVRAQEGTAARVYAAADLIEMRVTAATLSNFAQLDGAQTFTGVKTFSSGLVGNVTGNLTGNVAGNLTGDVTGNADTATTTPKLLSALWSVEASGSYLYFKYNGANVAKISSTGAVTALDDITAYGTP